MQNGKVGRLFFLKSAARMNDLSQTINTKTVFPMITCQIVLYSRNDLCKDVVPEQSYVWYVHAITE